MGCLTTVIIVPLFAYVLAAPLSFHLGGRWTPTAHWTGIGRLQDSAGALYGLYVTFWAEPNIEIRNETTSCCDLSGKVNVCTEGGRRIGSISRAPSPGPGCAATALR